MPKKRQSKTRKFILMLQDGTPLRKINRQAKQEGITIQEIIRRACKQYSQQNYIEWLDKRYFGGSRRVEASRIPGGPKTMRTKAGSLAVARPRPKQSQSIIFNESTLQLVGEGYEGY